MANPRLIAIEGPIGVGKEALARRLADRLSAQLISDEPNPFLGKFYSDRQSYAFQAQLFFLLSRYQQLYKLRQGELFQNGAVCDFLFDKNQIFARLNLDEQEAKLHDRLYQMLRERLASPDLVIYLYAEGEVLQRRLRSRKAGDGGPGVTEDYLSEVMEAYNSFFFEYADSPLLVVNTSHLDFEKRDRDLEALLKKMNSVSRGTHFWIPAEGTFDAEPQ